MSSGADKRKRPAGTPEGTGPEKQEPKRSKSFDPKEEAVPVARKPAMPDSRKAAGPQGAGKLSSSSDEVFDPQNRTVAEESLDTSDENQLFELALTTNLEEAMGMAETPEQKERVFAAMRAREAEKVDI